MTDIQKQLAEISTKAALAETACDSKGTAEGFRSIKKLADEALAAHRQQEARGAQIEAFMPTHPEPHSHRWTDLEKAAIRKAIGDALAARGIKGE